MDKEAILKKVTCEQMFDIIKEISLPFKFSESLINAYKFIITP